jgi:hypothetical protein
MRQLLGCIMIHKALVDNKNPHMVVCSNFVVHGERTPLAWIAEWQDPTDREARRGLFFPTGWGRRADNVWMITDGALSEFMALLQTSRDHIPPDEMYGHLSREHEISQAMIGRSSHVAMRPVTERPVIARCWRCGALQELDPVALFVQVPMPPAPESLIDPSPSVYLAGNGNSAKQNPEAWPLDGDWGDIERDRLSLVHRDLFGLRHDV